MYVDPYTCIICSSCVYEGGGVYVCVLKITGTSLTLHLIFFGAHGLQFEAHDQEYLL